VSFRSNGQFRQMIKVSFPSSPSQVTLVAGCRMIRVEKSEWPALQNSSILCEKLPPLLDFFVTPSMTSPPINSLTVLIHRHLLFVGRDLLSGVIVLTIPLRDRTVRSRIRIKLILYFLKMPQSVTLLTTGEIIENVQDQ